MALGDAESHGPYLVFWVIDEEAESPRQAAVQARAHQFPDEDGEPSIATVFDVYDKHTGQAWRVDLGETPDDAATVNRHDQRYCRALGRFAAAVP
jgi:hypothetical protein